MVMRRKQSSNFLNEDELATTWDGTDFHVEERPWKRSLKKFALSNYFAYATSALVVYALFADDIRLAAFDAPADAVFDVLSTVALFVFIMELVLLALFKKGYFPNFYFALDLLATLSMVPDITWIYRPLFNVKDDLDSANPSGSSVGSTANILKTSKASRVGTKTTKVVRIIRLIRMIRVVKFIKATGETDIDLEDQDVQVNASKVGKKLTEETTKKLIILVLLMVLLLPILDGSVNASDYNEYQKYGLTNLHRYPQDYNSTGNISPEMFEAKIESYVRDSGKLVYLHLCKFCVSNFSAEVIHGWLEHLKFQQGDDKYVSFTNRRGQTGAWEGHKAKDYLVWNNLEWGGWDDVTTEIKHRYRIDERNTFVASGCYNSNGTIYATEPTRVCTSVAVFDNKEASQQGAIKSIFKTIFVMFVLVIGSIMFTSDAQSLVIEPLERMIRLFDRLAKDPLRQGSKREVGLSDGQDEDFETAILEKTMTKITALLSVGFGAAGADIIAANVAKQGKLDVMVKGKKVTSVFGFGKIFEFTPTVSALGEDICMYINTIAKLVHTPCHEYYGFANKNIGNAFLLTWKICKGVLPGLRDPRDPPGEVTEEKRIQYMAQRENIFWKEEGAGKKLRKIYPMEMVDSSLCAFLKIMVDNYKANYQANDYHEFVNNEAMLKEFGKEKFKVRLGLGLHIGWAIEGPIGSKFKIDASYLSPNVNMAARLEAATEQFKCPLLLSEWLVGELSEAARSGCRMIDRVTVKGSQVPMSLYTYDIYFDSMKIYAKDFLKPKFNAMGEQEPVTFGSEEFQFLRHGIHPEFFETFDLGLNYYLSGNWQQAKEYLEKANMSKADGPTQVLLKVMEKNGFTKPAGWKGHRALTSK